MSDSDEALAVQSDFVRESLLPAVRRVGRPVFRRRKWVCCL